MTGDKVAHRNSFYKMHIAMKVPHTVHLKYYEFIYTFVRQCGMKLEKNSNHLRNPKAGTDKQQTRTSS